jgi:hypothetical protein
VSGGLDAGIAERHVQPAVRANGRAHRRGDSGFVADVARDGEGLVPGRGETVGGLPQGVLVDVGEDHRSAGLGEGAGGR